MTDWSATNLTSWAVTIRSSHFAASCSWYPPSILFSICFRFMIFINSSLLIDGSPWAYFQRILSMNSSFTFCASICRNSSASSILVRDSWLLITRSFSSHAAFSAARRSRSACWRASSSARSASISCSWSLYHWASAKTSSCDNVPGSAVCQFPSSSW